MAGQIDNKAKNTSRSSSWSAGTSIAAPGNANGAGGANLKKPRPSQGGGSAYNEGRSRLGSPTEVHHNGGTQGIKQGSTNPPR